MSYADKTLTCRDCGRPFSFTVGEQEFFAQKGFTNEPGRCPSCRAARRTSGGGGARYDSYGNGDFGAEPRRGPREMHETVCASCGGMARVPFVPRGDKPVYCSDCFAKSRGTGGGGGGGYGGGRGYR